MFSSDELKENMSIDDVIKVMAQLGATDFLDRGDHLAFRTVCHNLDEHVGGYNLRYYKDSKLFRCFSQCNESFDIINLAKMRLSLEDNQEHYYSEAFYLVLNFLDLDILPTTRKVENDYEINSKQYQSQSIEAPLNHYSTMVLDVFNTYRPIEWLQDGITPESMTRFNIRYSISRNMIIIPHYDVYGNLVGIRGRPLGRTPEELKKWGKYIPIKVEQTTYSHPLGLNLYGLYQNKENIKRTGIAIIAESEKAAMQADSILGENNVVVSVCGSSLNRWQILLLIKHCDVKEIVLAFDRENLPGDTKYLNHLNELCEKYKTFANFSFLYDGQNLLKMKESPFDKGADTFNILMKQRIKVK